MRVQYTVRVGSVNMTGRRQQPKRPDLSTEFPVKLAVDECVLASPASRTALSCARVYGCCHWEALPEALPEALAEALPETLPEALPEALPVALPVADHQRCFSVACFGLQPDPAQASPAHASYTFPRTLALPRLSLPLLTPPPSSPPPQIPSTGAATQPPRHLTHPDQRAAPVGPAPVLGRLCVIEL